MLKNITLVIIFTLRHSLQSVRFICVANFCRSYPPPKASTLAYIIAFLSPENKVDSTFVNLIILATLLGETNNLPSTLLGTRSIEQAGRQPVTNR